MSPDHLTLVLRTLRASLSRAQEDTDRLAWTYERNVRHELNLRTTPDQIYLRDEMAEARKARHRIQDLALVEALLLRLGADGALDAEGREILQNYVTELSLRALGGD